LLLVALQVDGRIRYRHLNTKRVGHVNMEPTSIDLDYDAVDIEDVFEGVVDAGIGVDLEVVEELQHQEDPIGSLTYLEVVQPVVDLLDSVKSPRIVVDRYPKDVVEEVHHSFQSPNSASKSPTALLQYGSHYPIPMRDYRRRWHLEFDCCMLHIMFQD
jgi:hypothetical protein